MKLFRPVAALALAAAAACTTAPAAEPEAGGYYVMRHLEKGEGPDPALSAQGKTNAQRMATRFEAPPRAIYVSTTRRARETAAPLAARLALTPVEYDPADSAALVARVLAGPRPALIVGHSNTVPEIVERLGGTRPAPLAESDFGDIWYVGGNPLRTEKMRL